MFAAYSTHFDVEMATQPSFETFCSGDRTLLGHKHPQQIRFTKSLVENLVAGCCLPMSVVENPCFRQFVADLNPRVMLPSRHHISYKLIPELRAEKLAAVQKHLSQVSFITLTMDFWTDR